MRLQISKTKNAASFYVVKSVYINGKRTNKVVEKLGTYEELRVKLGDRDPFFPGCFIAGYYSLYQSLQH